MQDSVSFYRIDPEEYRLRKQACRAQAYIVAGVHGPGGARISLGQVL